MSTNQQRGESIVEPRVNRYTDSQPQSATSNRTQYDTVIIYADGSYKCREEIAGIGFLIKSNGGEVIQKETKPVTAETSLETEAKAIKQAIQTALSFNPSHIVAHSDCKSLVEKVTDPNTDSELYDSIQSLIEPIEFVTIKHIDRDRNKHADELAHLALRREEDRVLNKQP